MAKETTKKDNKNKKNFFKDFKAELKKVIWPTPKQLVKNTIAVVFIVIVTAAIVFVLDVAFDALNIYGINHLKSAVKNSVVVEESTTENLNASNNETAQLNETNNETVEE
ncbi:MAG: preprotein translocase subunit SecE [Clostridia bacterium]